MGVFWFFLGAYLGIFVGVAIAGLLASSRDFCDETIIERHE